MVQSLSQEPPVGQAGEVVVQSLFLQQFLDLVAGDEVPHERGRCQSGQGGHDGEHLGADEPVVCVRVRKRAITGGSQS